MFICMYGLVDVYVLVKVEDEVIEWFLNLGISEVYVKYKW